MSMEEVYFGHHSLQCKRQLLDIQIQVEIIIPMTLERFFHRMGVCFVENNARRILNKWDFPVRHGEKRFLCPFSKHDPYYLSKFPLNFNGYFICGGTTHCDKKDVSHEISDM